MASCVPTGVAVLAVCVSVFILVERKMGATAALPLEMIASRALGGISAFTFLLYASFNLFLLAVPFVLLQGLHQAGTIVGMIFIPLQLAFVAITPVTGFTVRRVGGASNAGEWRDHVRERVPGEPADPG